MGRPRLPHQQHAVCHPNRWAVHGDRCQACAIQPEPPRRWAIAPTSVAPEACPHCKAATGWVGTLQYRHCLYCGEDWEVRARLVLV